MRIRDYPIVADIDGEDLLIVDTETGTKTIMSKDLIVTMANAIGSNKLQSLINFYDISTIPTTDTAEYAKRSSNDAFICEMATNKKHYRVGNDSLYADSIVSFGAKYTQKNALLRGYPLGSVITDFQKKSIHNGTFEGMGIRDYWQFADGIFLKIAGFNVFKGRYSNVGPSMPNHVLMYFETNKFKEAWGDSGSLYVQSHVKDSLSKDTHGVIYTYISGLVGEANIMPYHITLPTAHDENGYPTAYGNYISYMDVPSAAEVGITSPRSSYEYFNTPMNALFPLFRLEPYDAAWNGGASRWLRDEWNPQAAMTWNGSGYISNDGKATTEHFIQPFFLYSPDSHDWIST